MLLLFIKRGTDVVYKLSSVSAKTPTCLRSEMHTGIDGHQLATCRLNVFVVKIICIINLVCLAIVGHFCERIGKFRFLYFHEICNKTDETSLFHSILYVVVVLSLI